MKIIIAPDSFKNSLSSIEACRAIAEGIRRVRPDTQIVEVPVADGGEGTVEALTAATGGTYRRFKVHGPLQEKVEAIYGLLPDRLAVIEMAAAAGLPLVPEVQRNPLHTTTYGLGELMADAVEQGCQRLIIGIGGSATNDCGTGMAQALGVRFYDRCSQLIQQPMTGELMGQAAKIDMTEAVKRLKGVSIRVACDVTNPLLGPKGAARVYSPQKGADPAGQEMLETNAAHIIDIIEAATGRAVRDTPGAGAAGGLGAGLMAFAGAKLERGVDIVLDAARLDEKLTGADLVITGEGKLDGQTAFGKTIAGVAARARRQNIPVVALAGTVAPDAGAVHDLGVAAYLSICPGPITPAEALTQGATLLADAAEQIMRLINVAQRLH
ncbi:MAG: glycerate kinase [Sedimentisphaerales bacterium]|nr:glycerate kinase [Sedimentisphaerales bacterium]